MSRVEARYVMYDQIQFRTTAARLRDPRRNSTWTMPQSHQAMAPRNRTKPKSATADFRPIVARMPICRYEKAYGTGSPWSFARMTLATKAQPCLTSDERRVGQEIQAQ